MGKEEAEAVGHARPQSREVTTRRGKRRRQVGYTYHSGSLYAGPHVPQETYNARPMWIGQMRAVRAPAVTTLPTATVHVCGVKKAIKLDTGVQYCVDGETWQAYVERLNVLPPVDFVKGFTGALAKVLRIPYSVRAGADGGRAGRERGANRVPARRILDAEARRQDRLHRKRDEVVRRRGQ